MVEVGQIISGKYKLLRLLGDGGMGSVYEAEHLGLGTHVAIKVVHAELARRAGLIERFLQEARVSAQIRSPHVVRVMDVERTAEGVAYLVMDLLQGEPLSNFIRREGKLSTGTAGEYTLQILQALEAAHALGVIHRDLKPDNVFVTFEGGKPVLKLIDFGIAKLKAPEGSSGKNLTVAGMMMGTPEYMAPEQAYAPEKVDVRADLYSVGAMLYEMLSGRTPVSGEDPRVVVLKVERGEVEPLVSLVAGIQPEVAGFVHRAMATRPELRFASATEMRLALEGVLSGKRTQTAKLPASPPLPEGSGTMMGEPAPAALATPPVPVGSNRPPADALAQPAGSGTVRAPPIDPSASLAVAPPPMHFESETRAPKPARGGMGLVIGLAILALMLGAGAVVAYVWSTSPTTPVAVDPLAPTTTPTTPTTVTTAPVAVTPSTLTPPLTQPPRLPTTPPATPSAKPSGNAPVPSGSTSATPPVAPIPNLFPSGLPSSIPLPPNMPSGFPSSLQIPSGLPQFPFPPPPSQPPNP